MDGIGKSLWSPEYKSIDISQILSQRKQLSAHSTGQNEEATLYIKLNLLIRIYSKISVSYGKIHYFSNSIGDSYKDVSINSFNRVIFTKIDAS